MNISTNVKRYASNPRSRHRETMLQEVYDFCVDYITEEKIAPSLKEVAEGLYMSRANVTRYIDILEARGYIERNPSIPRSLRILEPPEW
jgi:SOS-response transcriptional repressor LexA